MVDGIVFGTCTAVGLLVTALCTRRAVGNPRVATWAIAIAFAICTLGVLCAVPTVANQLQHATGMPNAGKLVAHVCAILWCAAIQITMVDLAYRPEYLKSAVLQRAFAAALELAVMVPLFLAANRPDVQFTTEYIDDHRVAAYLLIYLSYVLVTCGELMFMCGRTSRRNWRVRPWSSVGFALSSVAAVLGMAYAVCKGSYVIFYTLDDPWPLGIEQVVSPTLSGLAVLFVFSGMTLPMVGALRERLREKRALIDD
ncbi:hypothetical protein AB0K80_33435 [Streptomyces sp. NPDC052682]|uniref:hypothetical protein n=1 Tax=Streptomyces sp. NPDC052682 TaxID=3154954 RepID=UPI00342D33FC